MRKTKLLIILFVALVLWTSVILYFSSQQPDVSNAQSGIAIYIIKKIDTLFNFSETELYRKIGSILEGTWFFERYNTVYALVRKSAHFGLYFILGIICTGFGYIYSNKVLMGFLTGVCLPVTIAVIDEFNQRFVSRTSSLIDVIIDGTGAATGTLACIVLILVVRLIRRVRKIYG